MGTRAEGPSLTLEEPGSYPAAASPGPSPRAARAPSPMENPVRPVLSVVVPVYREAAHLPVVLDAIEAALVQTGETYELICVDDGSPDDTWKVLSAEAPKRPNLRALRLSRNFGKESALVAGLSAACGAAVIVMDGDLQHPPALIPEMVKTWREKGVDVVEAVKERRGDESLLYKLFAHTYYRVFNRLSGLDLAGASDFKLLDRRVVDAWRAMGERNLFFRGMTSWLGFERARLPFKVPDRVGGRSGWSFFALSRLAATSITAFSSIPLSLITGLGIVFTAVAVVMGASALYLKLTHNIGDSFTTLILLVLLVGGLVMTSLGIVGVYVARIYDEVKQRPRFIVSRTLGRTYPAES